MLPEFYCTPTLNNPIIRRSTVTSEKWQINLKDQYTRVSLSEKSAATNVKIRNQKIIFKSSARKSMSIEIKVYLECEWFANHGYEA